MRTFDAATRNGAGITLRDPTDGREWRVSDWSPATRTVYGWPITGHRRGAYQRLPSHGLEIV